MSELSLDDNDRKILDLLRDNGRLTNQELAELIGLSASQCSRRRIALEQAGMILGYHAQLSPQADGTPVMGVIEVRMQSQVPEVVEAFHTFVARQPAIRDAFKLTGDYDYLLKVAVGNLAELSQLIQQLAGLRDCVGHLRTAVVLERLKEAGNALPDSELS
ncbi:MAG: AsnC family transcriptional regulator [Candidatus Dactylopiibacterium carminicum]|uniref:AsnC family transcriptional regulator n=1 Tax=Candidatus Dactylopiibacterium carminicum TaxID=857335 RepID=A0A272ES34_9RHOO|nr:Lrp/AsnC family transcriptional regulator [Candidatus Dactylopiibacterium carminicum]KAF7598939.1 Lrp/AsnC family transcriptional regulator [Candidatus Dactylopiibacterium carminicum]PAS92915.1 MAG: AsnC family transcriptional regulator [Candidatus Dactylopiibacterium carminicum]PAS96493.1 MAG: AsnC family transcriptional regulator [Candidatus Dactylopiibacterium carminicum]PAS98955.1 MAG: AsnC family transcriptional regulator [Candidatus Dactylopiibacterium carminicum]